MNLLDIHAGGAEPDVISDVLAPEVPDLRDKVAAGQRAVLGDGLAHAGYHDDRRDETEHEQPSRSNAGCYRLSAHEALRSDVRGVVAHAQQSKILTGLLAA